jgi:hypothetical protein
MQNEITSMRDEIKQLRDALVSLEERYDIDINVKKKRPPALKYNAKGRLLEFLKLDQIAVSGGKRVKAMSKNEFRLTKV